MSTEVILILLLGVVGIIGLRTARRYQSQREPLSVSTVKGSTQTTASALASLLFIGGVVWFFFLGGWGKLTADKLNEVHTQVADDFASRYEIAKRNGSAMDACVAAGFAAAGALQAKDEASYLHWKVIQKSDCRAAGLPDR